MTGVYSAYRNHCLISSKKLMQIIYDTLLDVTIVIAEGPYFSLSTALAAYMTVKGIKRPMTL